VRAGLVLAIAASLALGVLAEEIGPGWDDPRLWAPDLLVGWTLLAAAMLAWWWRRAAALALLLAATGVTWFLGVTPETLYWHRGPLVHLLLAYPGARPRGRLAAAAIAVGYLAAVVPTLWRDPTLAVLLSAGLVVVATHEARAAPLRERPARRTALAGAALLAAAVVAAAVLPAVLGLDAVLPSVHLYQAAVAVVGVLLLVRLPHRSPDALADAVVDLADQPAGSLQRRLASAVADPTLELAFWSAATAQFRTDAGEVVDPGSPASGRAVLVVTRDDRPLTALVHDPQSLRDPSLVTTVARAVRLADTNAALREHVDEVSVQIVASRRRLLLAADVERRDLDQQLQDGPERLLRELDRQLEALDDGHDPALTEARNHCREAQADLRRLSQGLHPRDLDVGGLEAAVRAAASRLPEGTATQVMTEALPARLPADVEATAYFVVAEALANVAKYAEAHEVRVELRRRPDALLVGVSDDGVGGAEPSTGTGLQGLADRVAALGGTFEVHSPLGAGTAVRACLPLRGVR
jgi:signal transduction histidine kinase